MFVFISADESHVNDDHRRVLSHDGVIQSLKFDFLK